MKKRIGLVGALVVIGLGAVAAFLLTTHVPAPVDPAWQLARTDATEPGEITVRFTGTSTLVFSDGETNLILDGWFTRAGPLSLAFGEIEPDVDAIRAGLARNEVDEAAVVIPVHAHFDHAMDAPEVARQTGALLVGCASTANLGRGWGLDENQIRVVRGGERMRFGAFEIVIHATRHFEFPDSAVAERALGDPLIDEPLVPPAAMLDYKLGSPLAVEIRHDRGSLLVQGSAGFVPGGFADVDVDVVFLGIGGLGTQTAEYRERYWQETVDATSPSRVVAIHWDTLTGPIEGPFRGEVRALSVLSGGGEKTLAFLREKQAKHPEIELATLPRYAPVGIFAR